MGAIHYAAFRFRERGLSIMTAVGPMLKTQECAERHW